MEEFTLEVARRSMTGSSSARRMRRDGFLPGVVYHKGEASVSVMINQDAFVQSAKKALPTQIFRLQSPDSGLNGRPVIVREVARLFKGGKQELVHVDMQALKDDEEIRLRVELKFVGEAPGVKVDGGILSISAHELEISCLLKDIPSELEIDISGLRVGDGIHASEVALPAGVKLVGESDAAVVSVVMPKQSKEESSGAAGAEGAKSAAPAGKAAPAAKSAPAAKK